MSLTLDPHTGAQAGAADPVNLEDAAPCTQLLDLLRALDASLLATLAEPSSAEIRRRFEWSRRELALAVSECPKRDHALPVWVEVRAAISRLAASGAQDFTPAPADRVVLASLRLNEWPGVAALMLLMPAWRCAQAPRLGQAPDAWWGTYTEWLFTPPQGFTAVGDAELYARHVHLHVRELAGWVHKNTGSGPVRAAAAAYVRVSNASPLFLSTNDLREHAELRAAIMKRVLAEREASYDLFALPREGRRLRVGFVNLGFGPSAATYTTLPRFEHLDPARFEVTLFTCAPEPSAVEDYARSRVSAFEVLPDDLAGQLIALRAASLDVVMFGSTLTAEINAVAKLALHRVAPLQCVGSANCITTGMPTVDLYVASELTATPESTGQFTERLGLLPGPAHAFNYDADRQQSEHVWTKAALGIAEDAFVFVASANLNAISPETREVWARLLAAVPGARLLLHPLELGASAADSVKRFCAEFELVLTRHGVDHNQLVVSAMDLSTRAELCALIGVGDLYLDCAGFGGAHALVDPLEAGVPVVAWEGATLRSRMGSALLRSIGLDQLIASDEAGYEKIVLGLVADPALRLTLTDKIKAVMELSPLFLDTLAASESLGDLLESAFDEVVEAGAEAFRKVRTPVRARRATPLTLDQRRAHGNELLEQGRPDRAVLYLMAALQHDDGTATLWLDVAKALRANGQTNDAIQALEAGLRLDETLVAGWEMLAHLAERAGNSDLAEAAKGVIATLKPKQKTNISGVLGKLRAGKSATTES